MARTSKYWKSTLTTKERLMLSGYIAGEKRKEFKKIRRKLTKGIK